PDVTSAPQAPIDAHRFILAENQDVVGRIQTIESRYEDTFVEFARAYGLGFDELVAANPGVDPWLPGEGTRIILPTRFVLPVAPRKGVVLNIAAKRLFFYPEAIEGQPRVVETFPIGIGRQGWATPTGPTTIVSKAVDPVWFVPRSVREEHLAAGDPLPKQVPPGPDNPLGNRVIGLDIPGYLIHGTNKPAGVGMRVSHGCVRLYPEDIEYFYEQVAIGMPVRLVNQPYLFGWEDDVLYLESHEPLNEDVRNWSEALVPMARSRLVGQDDRRMRIDENKIDQVAREHRGYPVPVTGGRRSAAVANRNVLSVINVLPQPSVDKVAD
ncbi:MAG: L,D-transpeptidase family protein, partial [Gammaproteobacteria bacterium]|nr:L,D-transpeptidase family protein [Gammaproteobacteria bacterium]